MPVPSLDTSRWLCQEGTMTAVDAFTNRVPVETGLLLVKEGEEENVRRRKFWTTCR